MAIIALALLACLLAGAISVIYPLRFLGIKSRKSGLGLVAVAIIGIFAVASSSDSGDRSRTQAASAAGYTTQARVASPVQVASLEPSLAVPEMERRLIASVSTSLARFNAGTNEMAKGSARPMRAREICSYMTSMNVDRWVGYVEQLTTNNEGRGVLAIRLPNSPVVVSTWNNAVSDIMHDTLIEPQSSIYSQAVALSAGQPVVFSGRFFNDEEDCLWEQSLSLEGSITEPEFVFRFSSIAPTT